MEIIFSFLRKMQANSPRNEYRKATKTIAENYPKHDFDYFTEENFARDIVAKQFCKIYV